MDVARDVADCLRRKDCENVPAESAEPARRAVQSSVALGELSTLDLKAAVGLLELFPIAKVGLAGCGDSSTISLADMHSRLQRLLSFAQVPSQIVLATYADHVRALAPPWYEVLDIAKSYGAAYMLIDTFVKDSQGLFAWLSVDDLQQAIQQAEQCGIQLVIAGSLRRSDWTALRELDRVIVGIRGAICVDHSRRDSHLNIDELNDWLRFIADTRACEMAGKPAGRVL